MPSEFDVFISYATEDYETALRLYNDLKRSGVKPWLDRENLRPGENWQNGVRQAIENSSYFLTLLSSNSVSKKGFVQKEQRIAIEILDEFPENSIFIIPVRLNECEVSFDKIKALHWVDLFPDYDKGLKKILQVLKPENQSEIVEDAMRIVLIYKRKAQPDEQVLTLLESHLTNAGHRVFIDRHIKIGDDWDKQITSEIKNADAAVILLSPASAYSEMVAHEVDIAFQTLQEKKKPRLFPIRINFEDPLPQELSNKLASLQYASWRGADDDMPLVAELLGRLTKPPQTSTDTCSPLEMVGGGMPLDSKFYVVRPVDEAFHSAVLRRDTIVLIKGARQVGKTSLLARGLQAAREAGVQVVLTDFQKLIDSQLKSLESFFFAVGEMLADQLDLDVCPQDNWKPNRAPNTNFERYFRREILAKTQKPLLWAMDETDRLFHCDFGTEIFAMFRTWHNERALNPDGPCSRLTLAIAYATEAYLFIKDQNQSPFNVGTKINLADFSFEHIADLNRRYGSPLNHSELHRFYELVGGQPYLVRRGFNDIVSFKLNFNEFADKADHDDGVFGDHLRRILMLLNRNPELSEVMLNVLKGGSCPDYDSFYKLRSAGILSGDAKDHVQPRCEIYAAYLKKHLM